MRMRLADLERDLAAQNARLREVQHSLAKAHARVARLEARLVELRASATYRVGQAVVRGARNPARGRLDVDAAKRRRPLVDHPRVGGVGVPRDRGVSIDRALAAPSPLVIVPAAAGIAWAEQLSGSDRISTVFIGDGTLGEVALLAGARGASERDVAERLFQKGAVLVDPAIRAPATPPPGRRVEDAVVAQLAQNDSITSNVCMPGQCHSSRNG